MVEAPFTDKQVLAILKFQYSGIMHPFTCPREHVYAHAVGELPRELTRQEQEAFDDAWVLELNEVFKIGHVLLMPSVRGLFCPHELCGYTQNWVHEFMTDLQKVEEAIRDNDAMFGAPLTEEDLDILSETFKRNIDDS